MRLKMGRTSISLEVMKPMALSSEEYGYHTKKLHGWYGGT